MKKTAQDRFTESFQVSVNGCWLWTRSKRGDVGFLYGRIYANGKQHSAHRFSYELNSGPIPEGMLVCHSCDTPLCVNPAHLFLGTPKTNMSDRDRKMRMARGELNGMAKLSANDISSIRLDQRSQTDIADQYGVSQGTISNIKRNIKWRHVE